MARILDMHAMSNTLVPASYPLSTDPPIITSLECKVRLGRPSTYVEHLPFSV